MLNYEFTANDTEKTFVYEDKDGFRVNLSKLVAVPNDPPCVSLAKYNKENGNLVMRFELDEEEQKLLRKLLSI